MSDQRRLTFEQCMRLIESLKCPDSTAKAERAKLLEFAEKAILDYWTLCQLLGGSVHACVDFGGEVSYIPVPGKSIVKIQNWPPSVGKDEIEEPIPPENSVLYSPHWSGEHKAADISGEYSTEWLGKHPEAKPRPRFSV